MEGFLHLTSISNKLCLQLVKLMQTLAKCKPGFGNIAMCGCVNSTVHKGPGENYSEQYQKITVGLFHCVLRFPGWLKHSVVCRRLGWACLSPQRISLQVLQDLAFLPQFTIDFYKGHLPSSFCDVTSSLPQTCQKVGGGRGPFLTAFLTIKMTAKILEKTQ